ncbi:Transcription factor A mitochondrial [Paragonimus heterotremus]|uniref:Transcription factor A mitochondrial n=1 Tax=Paragonimus heterotremus TaxID=100268 RepID=A0A8J4SZT1_9TREM|nr:Transcription factor A mitochondrial [Paragonimus heterotremus]
MLSSIRKLTLDISCCSLSCARLSTSSCLSAPNAFNLFVKTKYGELKQSDPSLKSTEIFRKLGEEYRKLTSKQKEELKSHGSTIASQMDVTLVDKRKRLMYAHKHGMPRKPPISGLNVYIREKLCDLKGQPITKVATKLRDAVQNWKSLSPSEQATYGLKAQQLKATYEKELEAWASEHDLRFTRNLQLLTTRFYERCASYKRAEAKRNELGTSGKSASSKLPSSPSSPKRVIPTSTSH